MERNHGCQGRKRHEGIEGEGDYSADKRHSGECLLEDIGQRYVNQRRATVGLHTYRERRWEYHQTGKDGDKAVYDTYLYG